MEIKEIQNLIKFVAKSGAHEVKLETDDFKITIKTSADIPPSDPHTTVQTVPSMVVQAPQVPAAVVETETQSKPTVEPAKEDTDNLITIKSPMIGTFYRKPSPDKNVFVEVGDTIKDGDVLCVIEAMKLFNEIESEFSGKIVKILVEDSSPVEFDQPLFLVEPS
ncbi:MAG: acetyl-CoA carboxylase biotin carboxyl carrier protein [Flavobacteriaceae bacterium]|jgi:acetyl-CoA carboxylase biotin carboxyl carrier protein